MFLNIVSALRSLRFTLDIYRYICSYTTQSGNVSVELVYSILDFGLSVWLHSGSQIHSDLFTG
jgi:hypothetical protein